MEREPREPRILPFGDAALLVEFGQGVDRALNDTVLALDAAVAAAGIEGVVETAPSFRSLMIQFDPLTTDLDRIAVAVRGLLGAEAGEARGRRWSLPACYEGDLAPDLEGLARETGLSPAEVVAHHTAIDHHVYMIGFLPGSPYMGDLPEVLTLPRRRDPRTRVPKGSVAIAVGLTVIYPVESPGGWHLLGNTPVRVFDPGWAQPALLAPGDVVRFEPVRAAEHARLSADIAAGRWRPEPVG
ncbi:MAG: 5-oxoprolinase subunit PxpB [Pseudomonadota bacterium]